MRNTSFWVLALFGGSLILLAPSQAVTADTTAASPTLPPQPAVGGTLPALPGDPMRYSQQELVKAGYMLRPDNPSKEWLDMVSKPKKIFKPELKDTGVKMNTQFINQCGGIMSQNATNGNFVAGEGLWTVDVIDYDPTSYMGQWVGIGGPSPQCGTMAIADPNVQN